VTLKPIKNKIIVRPDPTPAMIGSIHVPENIAHGEDANPNYFTTSGTVIAVGPAVLETIPVGHKVHYNRYAGTQIKDWQLTGDELWLVMTEDDIEGVLPPDAPTLLPGYIDAADDGVKSLPGDRGPQ
jgi:co-chaperonin GroES (HSP10)